jgi:hypothetical protein
VLSIALAMSLTPAVASASISSETDHAAWSSGTKIDTIPGNSPEVNSSAVDGCPIQAPDGLSLYLASTRPRFPGDARTDLDIWVATRSSTSDGWGAPVNLGAPVNTAADDFCPTPVGGDQLFFVSRRTLEGVTCGLGDIFLTRRQDDGIWREPDHLGCGPDGPNSALDEQGPAYLKAKGVKQLYFSRSRAASQPGGAVPGDIFVADQTGPGEFGAAVRVGGGVNGTGNDIQPNLRRDGLEMVFSSNQGPDHIGGQDVYAVTRSGLDEDWSAPVNLGPSVNTTAGETRPSLSRDARQLLFGRSPGVEGAGPAIPSDIFVSFR